MSSSAYADCLALASQQHGLFTIAQARARGLSQKALGRRVAAGILAPALPGVVRCPGGPTSWKQELMAGVLWAGHDAAASHRAAARLWELDGFRFADPEVSCLRDLRLLGRGPRVHLVKELAAIDVECIDGIPVTSPARTILDLARSTHRHRLERAFDAAWRRDLIRLPAMWEIIERLGGRGRKGVRLLRSIVAERDDGEAPPDSALETDILSLINESALPKPTRQFPIVEARRTIMRIDVSYPLLKVAIEAYGYAFHSSKPDWQRDMERERALAARGWLVLRHSWDDVHDRPGYVLADIDRHLAIRERALNHGRLPGRHSLLAGVGIQVNERAPFTWA